MVIEFEDGSKKMVEFSQLNRGIWFGLSRLGLCAPPPPLSELSDYYLLFQWKDGWQEVVGLRKREADLLRYYTIERVEEEGRMALEIGEEYPALFLIKRLPRQVKGLWIIGGKEKRYYPLGEKQTLKEGGKVEHILYDRKNPNFFKEDSQRAEALFGEVLDSIREEVKKEGLSPKEVLAMDLERRVEKYKEWSRALGVTAMERQEDLYGFMQLLLIKLCEVER